MGWGGGAASLGEGHGVEGQKPDLVDSSGNSSRLASSPLPEGWRGLDGRVGWGAAGAEVRGREEELGGVFRKEQESWESPKVSKKELALLGFFLRLFLVLDDDACRDSLVDSKAKLDKAWGLLTTGWMFRWLPQTPELGKVEERLGVAVSLKMLDEMVSLKMLEAGVSLGRLEMSPQGDLTCRGQFKEPSLQPTLRESSLEVEERMPEKEGASCSKGISITTSCFVFFFSSSSK